MEYVQSKLEIIADLFADLITGLPQPLAQSSGQMPPR